MNNGREREKEKFRVVSIKQWTSVRSPACAKRETIRPGNGVS